MVGRDGALDKLPWKNIDPPRGPVERQFLRPLALGECLTPYRLLPPVTAVIPLDGQTLLDSRSAAEAGFRHLAEWLKEIEGKWAAHCNKDANGAPRLSLSGQIDYLRKLTGQTGTQTMRVLYTKAGLRLSAARIAANDVIIDTKAYWATARSTEEASYLIAVLNSATALAKISDLQPRGEFNPRDFDNLIWTLPIPEYDPNDTVHQELAAAALRAEAVAAAVPLAEGQHFVAKRKAIRLALIEDGVAAEIEALVDALLPV